MKISLIILSLIFVSCQTKKEKTLPAESPVIVQDSADIETGLNTDTLCLD
jgi:hypothetical protein